MRDHGKIQDTCSSIQVLDLDVVNLLLDHLNVGGGGKLVALLRLLHFALCTGSLSIESLPFELSTLTKNFQLLSFTKPFNSQSSTSP